MIKWKWEYLYIIIKWAAAIIFIVAGISKILNPSGFADDIDNYRLLPYWLVTIVAAILPWIEFVCGLLLILNKGQKGAAGLLLLLSVIFLIAIISAIMRDLDITCGCFSFDNHGTKVGYHKLFQDILLFLILCIIYYRTAILADN